jgi:hypothetical protein
MRHRGKRWKTTSACEADAWPFDLPHSANGCVRDGRRSIIIGYDLGWS